MFQHRVHTLRAMEEELEYMNRRLMDFNTIIIDILQFINNHYPDRTENDRKMIDYGLKQERFRYSIPPEVEELILEEGLDKEREK